MYNKKHKTFTKLYKQNWTFSYFNIKQTEPNHRTLQKTQRIFFVIQRSKRRFITQQ